MGLQACCFFVVVVFVIALFFFFLKAFMLVVCTHALAFTTPSFPLVISINVHFSPFSHLFDKLLKSHIRGEESVSLGCCGNRVSHSAAVSLVTLTPTVCFPLFPFFPSHRPDGFLSFTHMLTHSWSIFPRVCMFSYVEVQNWLMFLLLIIITNFRYLCTKEQGSCCLEINWTCMRLWSVQASDDKGDRNIAALPLITYLWRRLISKPRVEKHAVKETGRRERRWGGHWEAGGHLTLILFQQHLLALI